MKLVIENKGSSLDKLEELKTTIQYHWECYYHDKDTDDDSDDEESEYEKNKYHAFNKTEKKNRICQGSNDKVVFIIVINIVIPKIFYMISYTTHWEDRRDCFERN